MMKDFRLSIGETEPLRNGCLSASTMPTCSPIPTLKRKLTEHRQHKSTPIWKKCLHSLPDSAAAEHSFTSSADSFRKRHANFDSSTRSAKGHACIYELRMSNCSPWHTARSGSPHNALHSSSNNVFNLRQRDGT